MFKINNLSMLMILGGSFVAGRMSRGSKLETHLNGMTEGISEGYARALVELHLHGKLTKEDLEEFMERV